MINENESPCNGNKFCKFVDETFLKHPRSAGEHYFTHLLFTLKIAGYLIITALCAVTHGLCPKFLQTRASDRVIMLAEDLQERRRKNMAIQSSKTS